MWKVLGVETPIIAAGDVWISRMSELSSRKKDAPKFRELLSKANIRYYFDTIREVHVFYVRFPSDVEMSDLEFFRDFIVKLEKSSKIPVVEYEGESQTHTTIISSDEEQDDHVGRNNWWELGEDEVRKYAF
ncbi:hypothetical protein [Candidatus Methanomassiliicoccus intestinalis]|jgi:hypothetical protein|uniref:Uncharacterized protein n=2 Tax=Candidatus Methanomassiliicoccus intestinalis TaxID=1406512 RepID=R9T4K2_METII|nr:hypothetical protein [Candidatus Methanomassiliicoccus intestinalis]AGN25655.1 hypothetical protein MMINT_02530 [Candidatus Methanomassiliicoccus intestinalis Issoire-Mx1]TQS80631.1 MAG: hypothetical protein A3206_05025 [Candidatus Methanomassiliicoccus intestinalis]TQS81597.1 MAG: hypothetical protein A3207_04130 [Candidatus Methanomassiliicoccus intestinalis]